MPEIKARTRLTFHQLVEGQSSYTHIRYSADGKTFTPASAAALEQAKNWPIEGRNLLKIKDHSSIGSFFQETQENSVIKFPWDSTIDIRKDDIVTFALLLKINEPIESYSITMTSTGSNWWFRFNTRNSGVQRKMIDSNTILVWKSVKAVADFAKKWTFAVANERYSKSFRLLWGGIFKGEVNDVSVVLSPEDAAIGTTPGRYRGEVVTNSPIAPIDFNAYTWSDTKGEKGDKGEKGNDATTIYLRGTGFNRKANGILRIGGADIVNGGWSGLRMVTLRRDTLEKVSDWIAVYANAADWEALKTRLNALDENVFVALMSYDATNLGQSHIDVLESFGADIPANFGINLSSTSGVAHRRPFVFLGYKGLPKGRALWMLSGLEATAPFAEVSTYVADRTFVSADKGDRGERGERGNKGDKGDRGERGQKGDNGRSVTAVKTQYYLSTSKAVQQGGAWQDTPPSWQKGKYLWTRLHTSFSDGSSTTTAPVVDSGWEIQGQLQIGGTNLFGFRRGLQYWGLHTVIAPNSGIKGVAVKISAALQNGVLCRIQKLGFGRPGLYTVSGYIKATKAVRLQLDICDAGQTVVDVTTELKPFQLTANVTMYWQADNYNGFFDIEAPTGNNLQPGNVIEVHNLMIERGNIASDYRQAEEDATYMQKILDETLRIEKVSVGGENGVSFAGRFEARELKNDEYITRSFLNGDTAGTRPAFAAGVEKFGMPTESYATALYHDGSGHIGQMSFTPDGQMYVGRGAIEESKVRFSGLPMPDLNKLNDMLTATSSIGTSVVTAEANAGSTPNSYYRVDATAHSTGQLEVKTPIGQLSVNGRFEVSFVKRMPVEQGTFPFAEGELVLVGVNNNKRYHLASVRTNTPSGYDHETITLDTKLYNLSQGLYRLEVHAWAYGANSVRGKFTPLSATTYVGRIDKPLTSVHTDGILSYQRPDQFAAVKDGKLTVKGEMDIPGVLLAGRVKENGQPKVYWGSKARKIGTKTQRLQWVGTYRVYHTIGHENYAPIVTGIGDNQHIFGQLTTIAADYFDVCIKSVNGTFVNGEFSFSVFGAN